MAVVVDVTNGDVLAMATVRRRDRDRARARRRSGRAQRAAHRPVRTRLDEQAHHARRPRLEHGHVTPDTMFHVPYVIQVERARRPYYDADAHVGVRACGRPPTSCASRRTSARSRSRRTHAKNQELADGVARVRPRRSRRASTCPASRPACCSIPDQYYATGQVLDRDRVRRRGDRHADARRVTDDRERRRDAARRSCSTRRSTRTACATRGTPRAGSRVVSENTAREMTKMLEGVVAADRRVRGDPGLPRRRQDRNVEEGARDRRLLDASTMASFIGFAPASTRGSRRSSCSTRHDRVRRRGRGAGVRRSMQFALTQYGVAPDRSREHAVRRGAGDGRHDRHGNCVAPSPHRRRDAGCAEAASAATAAAARRSGEGRARAQGDRRASTSKSGRRRGPARRRPLASRPTRPRAPRRTVRLHDLLDDLESEPAEWSSCRGERDGRRPLGRARQPRGRSRRAVLLHPGSRADGHDVRAGGRRRGRGGAARRATGSPLDVPQARVASVRAVLGPIAARFFGEPSRAMRVLGVTGTNGKTTHDVPARSDRGRGRRSLRCDRHGRGARRRRRGARGVRTTPEATELQALLAGMRDDGVETVAMEVSSHALDQHRVDGTVFAAVVLHEPLARAPRLSPDGRRVLRGQEPPVHPRVLARCGRGQRRRSSRRSSSRGARRRRRVGGALREIADVPRRRSTGAPTSSRATCS